MKLHEMTPETARAALHAGTISYREWQRFEKAWLWGAPRFSGAAGMLHDGFHARRGSKAYSDRITRVRRALDALREQETERKLFAFMKHEGYVL